MSIDDIRTKVRKLGWSLKELPVRRHNPDQSQYVAHWKLVAFKESRSVEVTGTTLEQAMENIGKTLGVIG